MVKDTVKITRLPSDLLMARVASEDGSVFSSCTVKAGPLGTWLVGLWLAARRWFLSESMLDLKEAEMAESL